MTQNNEREALIADAKEAGFTVKDMPTGLVIGTPDNHPLGELLSKFAYIRDTRAKSLISQNEQQPKQMPDGWISVNDRLPKKYTEVLVYPQPNEYTHCAIYGKFKNKQIDDGWFYGEYEAGIGHENYTCKVTHWMPLPTAPTNTEVGE